MNIMVTGGCGFIGSNLIKYLLIESGLEIDNLVNIDALTYAGNPKNINHSIKEDSRYHNRWVDICDKEEIAHYMDFYDITHIFHLAAESHVDNSIEGPDIFMETNVKGTAILLECFKNHIGAQPDPSIDHRFIHVSTDEVYGELLSESDAPFTEETPYAPNSPYAASKASSDFVVRSYFKTYGLPVITTNCSNNYGPNQCPEKLIPLMIGKVLAGEDLPIYGNGQNIRDWLYVKDHCKALVAVLTNGVIGESYVIGGRCERNNIDIVSKILKIVYKEMPELIGKSHLTFVEDRLGHDQRYAINPIKIETDLGWTPEENFETGLDKTVKWYINNQQWVENSMQRLFDKK